MLTRDRGRTAELYRKQIFRYARDRPRLTRSRHAKRVWEVVAQANKSGPLRMESPRWSIAHQVATAFKEDIVYFTGLSRREAGAQPTSAAPSRQTRHARIDDRRCQTSSFFRRWLPTGAARGGRAGIREGEGTDSVRPTVRV